MRRAYILLSGGIDSTTCLHIANHEFRGPLTGVSIDYGQRHKKEIEYAKALCKELIIPHRTIDLQDIIPSTMLTNENKTIPSVSYEEIEGISPTYVPYRNGFMLSAVASLAQGSFQSHENSEPEWAIYFGAHAEDAHNWAYPDCTPEFIGAMANAIYIGTYRTIRLHTPLQWLTKAEIIEKGDKLGVDWSMTWSCYKGETLHCGICPTCRARKKAFVNADVTDPTEYAT
jgi:7-cyano-7-deazaguanine synthase